MRYKTKKVKLVDIDKHTVTVSLCLNNAELGVLCDAMNKDFKDSCRDILNNIGGPVWCAEKGLLYEKIAMKRAEIIDIISRSEEQ